LWFHRAALRHNFNAREAPYGLVYLEHPFHTGICYGSSSLQAWHFAALLNATEIHLTGCEFYFPEGEQHADGTAAYRADSGDETAVINFDIVKGRPVAVADGPYKSTPYFLASAAAFRKVLKLGAAQGVKTIDHSGGLLSLDTFGGTAAAPNRKRSK
jgi:hypothetical protein